MCGLPSNNPSVMLFSLRHYQFCRTMCLNILDLIKADGFLIEICNKSQILRDCEYIDIRLGYRFSENEITIVRGSNLNNKLIQKNLRKETGKN